MMMDYDDDDDDDDDNDDDADDDADDADDAGDADPDADAAADDDDADADDDADDYEDADYDNADYYDDYYQCAPERRKINMPLSRGSPTMGHHNQGTHKLKASTQTLACQITYPPQGPLIKQSKPP